MEYDKQHDLLLLKATGAISMEEVEALGHQVLNSSQFRPDVNALWDLNELDFNEATYEFAMQLIAYRKTIDGERANAKVALASSYVRGEPLLKLYQVMAKELSQQTRVFRSVDEAMVWLCE